MLCNLGKESDHLRDVITEYPCDQDADLSDESDSDAVLSQEEEEEEEGDDEDDEDEPVLESTEVEDEDETQEGTSSDPIFKTAKEFSCGCQLVKAAAAGDGRKGCVTKFSPEEIAAIMLSAIDMERSK